MTEIVDPSGSRVLAILGCVQTRLGELTAGARCLVKKLAGESAFVKMMRGAAETLFAQASASVSWKVARRLVQFGLPGQAKPGAGLLLGVALGLALLHSSELAVLALFTALVWRLAEGRPDPRSGKTSPHEPAIGVAIRQPRMPAGLLLPLTALMLFATGSAIASVTPSYSLRNLVMWWSYAVAFVLGLDASRRGRERDVAVPVILACTVASLYGIYQYLTGFRSYEGWLDTEFEDLTRIVGTFPNPSFFSQALALVIPVSVVLVLSAGNLRRSGVAAIYAFLQAIALVLTLGRAAWLGCLLSISVVAAFFDRRLLVLGLVLLVVILPFLPDYVVKRFVSAFSTEDSSNRYRISVWRGSVALARAHLLTGTGLGAESFVYTYPDYMVIGTTAWHSHCVYLQVLIEMGIFGFAAFLWLLAAWGRCTWRGLRAAYLSRSGGEGRIRKVGAAVCLATASAVLGSLAQGLVEHTLYSPRVALIFWTWAGISAGLCLRRDLGMSS